MDGFQNLSDREKQVLANLIEYYISSADPVGSRVIANKFKMGLSSATIRNTLQDLEELGLVEQPHTSAGRIPTDSGYRVYVDYLIKPEKLTPGEQRVIRQAVTREGTSINEILGQTARLLAEITKQLGVSIAPRFEIGRLQSIRLIGLAEGRIMVVVIVQSGLARSLILEVEAAVTESQLKEVESTLNERLGGLSLAEIRDTITQRVGALAGQGRLIQLLVDSKERIWTDSHAEELHVAGTNRLISMPEFVDRDRLLRLLQLLEDGKELAEFLSAASHEGLVITIGRENPISQAVNCSVVTSQYHVGEVSGTIGVIGPTRMPYSKLVSVVEYTARSISEVLSGMKSSGEGL